MYTKTISLLLLTSLFLLNACKKDDVVSPTPTPPKYPDPIVSYIEGTIDNKAINLKDKVRDLVSSLGTSDGYYLDGIANKRFVTFAGVNEVPSFEIGVWGNMPMRENFYLSYTELKDLMKVGEKGFSIFKNHGSIYNFNGGYVIYTDENGDKWTSESGDQSESTFKIEESSDFYSPEESLKVKYRVKCKLYKSNEVKEIDLTAQCKVVNNKAP